MQIKSKIFLLLLLQLSLYSHSLVLNIMDNEDGTIMVSGAFNTGESAAGAMVKVQIIDSEEIIFQKRLPADEELNISIPKVPYNVILDGGEGHAIVKEGIAPLGGFIKEKKKKEKKRKSRLDTNISANKAVTVSLIFAFLLLLATMYVSSRNTQKLINQLKNN